jgi:hypothetical protein
LSASSPKEVTPPPPRQGDVAEAEHVTRRFRAALWLRAGDADADATVTQKGVCQF